MVEPEVEERQQSRDDLALQDHDLQDVQVNPEGHKVTKMQVFTVGIVCFLNFINYVDRYTIAAVLYDIQRTFDISDAQAGLLSTAFTVVYMLMAPVFGYLGDRCSRKYLMSFGILCWSTATLLGSFMPTYGSFLAMRCVVGVGEASYTTTSPTIISDLFVGDMRSNMLIIFTFATPVGVGIGFMMGSSVLTLVSEGMTEEERIEAECWRWSLRVTPWLGMLGVLLILLFVREPKRGTREGAENLKITSFRSDLKYLVTHKVFVLTTLGFSVVSFVLGSLAWWVPTYMDLGVKLQGDSSNVPYEKVGVFFGATVMFAGLIGVPLGSIIGQKWRVRFPPADPVVCGIGLTLNLPFLVGAVLLADSNTAWSLTFSFFGQLCENLNWAVVADITLYTIVPTRRSSSQALLLTVSHTLGDASGPYMLGLIAESFKPHIDVPGEYTTYSTASPDWNWTTSSSTQASGLDDDDYIRFMSLQYAMLIVSCFSVLGAAFFFWDAFYLVEAKEECDRTMKESRKSPLSAHDGALGICNKGYTGEDSLGQEVMGDTDPQVEERRNSNVSVSDKNNIKTDFGDALEQ